MLAGGQIAGKPVQTFKGLWVGAGKDRRSPFCGVEFEYLYKEETGAA
jgi:hypothetical protein